MQKTAVKAVIIASLSATTGLLISQNTPTIQSAITVPMAAWLIYQFSSGEKAWNSLSNFQNPILFGINTFFLSFIYYSWKTAPVRQTTYISTGIFLIAAATSLLIYKYWNIGG